MTCPFLKEAQVKYCRAASVRKLIPLAQAARAGEKCSSGAYRECQVYRTQACEDAEAASCPYLHESAMQYCAAAPVAKYVPYSESVLSRCGNDSYRYCELYLGMAHPDAPSEEVDGIAVPARLEYSSNHMWLEITEDGTCHAGVDAFLARALGRVDRISYVRLKGQHRPAAVLTVDGVDLEVVFPNEILLTGCNLYLRADPSRIVTEPYTGGWLFEGRPVADTERGLAAGAEARTWMEREEHRMNEFLQEQQGLAADGGMFAPGVARQLTYEQRRALFHDFFSQYAGGKR